MIEATTPSATAMWPILAQFEFHSPEVALTQSIEYCLDAEPERLLLALWTGVAAVFNLECRFKVVAILTDHRWNRLTYP